MAVVFDPFRTFDRLASTQRAAGWMPMDLYRTGDDYVVSVDLPGVSPESIDIDVDQNVLTISARREGVDVDGGKWLANERPSGSFKRQLTLSEGLNVEAITADYAAGVLTLRIPVAEAAKPRKIQVRSSESAAGSQVEAGAAGPVQVESAA